MMHTIETAKRLARLRAREFPTWLINHVNRLIWEAVLGASGIEALPVYPVPVTWLVDPRRKDRLTVAVRCRIIDGLLASVVQRRSASERLRDRNGQAYRALEFRLVTPVTREGVLAAGWRPLSRPNVAALLGMEQSTITLVIKKMGREIGTKGRRDEGTEGGAETGTEGRRDGGTEGGAV